MNIYLRINTEAITVKKSIDLLGSELVDGFKRNFDPKPVIEIVVA